MKQVYEDVRNEKLRTVMRKRLGKQALGRSRKRWSSGNNLRRKEVFKNSVLATVDTSLLVVCTP